MTDTPKVQPASEEEIAAYLHLHRKDGGGYWNCDLDANISMLQLIARIDSDRARIGELEEENKQREEEIEWLIEKVEKTRLEADSDGYALAKASEEIARLRGIIDRGREMASAALSEQPKA